MVADAKTRVENKFVDLTLLPPCRTVLRLHAERANLVAYILKKSLSAQINLPNYSDCGWNNSGEIQWVTASYPDFVEDILFDEEYEDYEEYGSDGISDDGENDDLTQKFT